MIHVYLYESGEDEPFLFKKFAAAIRQGDVVQFTGDGKLCLRRASTVIHVAGDGETPAHLCVFLKEVIPSAASLRRQFERPHPPPFEEPQAVEGAPRQSLRQAGPTLQRVTLRGSRVQRRPSLSPSPRSLSGRRWDRY